MNDIFGYSDVVSQSPCTWILMGSSGNFFLRGWRATVIVFPSILCGCSRSLSKSVQGNQHNGATVDPKCPICLDAMVNARTIKCGHIFCEECLRRALGIMNICPICKEPQGIVTGNQPPGQMTWSILPSGLPGYFGCGTICIQYTFPAGIQGPEHPNPGQPYSGTFRAAYLPDNHEGREVLQLLRRAFDSRLIFTVGTSITTGLSNQITWNDIHHKTNKSGGAHSFGYPDPHYLRRVREDLAAKGIRWSWCLRTSISDNKREFLSFDEETK